MAILGYHDFSRTLPATEMRMNTDTFRAQMQALKTAGVPIITMKDFLDWKLGDKQLPAKCVLITIDDGWKSVYTDAYPILREMKIPFTVFPYTKFITGRGSAMSREQIQEMLNNEPLWAAIPSATCTPGPGAQPRERARRPSWTWPPRK